MSAENASPTTLDDVERRALTDPMAVLPDLGLARDAPGLYTVVTEHTYTVDLRTGSCECPDAAYRDRACKHRRRAQYATGQRPIPAWVNRDALDDNLGAFADRRPVFESEI